MKSYKDLKCPFISGVVHRENSTDAKKEWVDCCGPKCMAFKESDEVASCLLIPGSECTTGESDSLKAMRDSDRW